VVQVKKIKSNEDPVLLFRDLGEWQSFKWPKHAKYSFMKVSPTTATKVGSVEEVTVPQNEMVELSSYGRFRTVEERAVKVQGFQDDVEYSGGWKSSDFDGEGMSEHQRNQSEKREESTRSATRKIEDFAEMYGGTKKKTKGWEKKRQPETADEQDVEKYIRKDGSFDLGSHNGTVTMTTPAGERYTFQVKTQSQSSRFAPGARVLSVLESGNKFDSFAFVKDTGQIAVWKKKRGDVNTSKESAFEVHARVLANPARYVKKGYEFLFSGRCRKCNRLLTTEASLKSGIGPDCK
jgi:hypothetical protein|tara:strand:+ start:1460 stop:2335 length:876 start_codon:yes stop_codon:yes gene_type:complete